MALYLCSPFTCKYQNQNKIYMQSNRSGRRGSFQERDSEGRFASEGRRGNQNDWYDRDQDRNDERGDRYYRESDRGGYQGNNGGYGRPEDQDDNRLTGNYGSRWGREEDEDEDDNYGPRGRYD